MTIPKQSKIQQNNILLWERTEWWFEGGLSTVEIRGRKNRPTRAINAFHKHFIRSSLFVLVKNIPRVPATMPKISPTNFITISITSAGWGSIKWTVGIHKITTKYLISSWFYGANSGIGDITILIDHSILSLWCCTYVRSWLLSSNPTNASHLFAEPRWKPLKISISWTCFLENTFFGSILAKIEFFFRY